MTSHAAALLCDGALSTLQSMHMCMHTSMNAMIPAQMDSNRSDIVGSHLLTAYLLNAYLQ